jgi:hypothetical protein
MRISFLKYSPAILAISFPEIVPAPGMFHACPKESSLSDSSTNASARYFYVEKLSLRGINYVEMSVGVKYSIIITSDNESK